MAFSFSVGFEVAAAHRSHPCRQSTTSKLLRKVTVLLAPFSENTNQLPHGISQFYPKSKENRLDKEGKLSKVDGNEGNKVS